MKLKHIIFLIAIFSITFSANSVFAFYKGWWKTEDNKKLVNITDETIMFDKQSGKIVRLIKDGDNIIILAMSNDDYKELSVDEINKIKNFDFQTLSTYGPTIQIKKIDDTKITMDMPFSPKRTYIKISGEEANKLLQPQK